MRTQWQDLWRRLHTAKRCQSLPVMCFRSANGKDPLLWRKSSERTDCRVAFGSCSTSHQKGSVLHSPAYLTLLVSCRNCNFGTALGNCRQVWWHSGTWDAESTPLVDISCSSSALAEPPIKDGWFGQQVDAVTFLPCFQRHPVISREPQLQPLTWLYNCYIKAWAVQARRYASQPSRGLKLDFSGHVDTRHTEGSLW